MKLLLLLLVMLGLAIVAAIVGAHLNPNPLPQDVFADRILVEKSARRMTLFRGETVLKTYRVALGREPIGAKEFEGDQRTPEGFYTIDFHKPDSDYHLALHISYPEQRDIDREAPNNRSAGSDIMIHGLRNGTGWIGALHRQSDGRLVASP